MVVRLRLRPVRRVSRKHGKNRHLALALASLMWPGVFTAYVLGFWRLGADLGMAGGFGITSGVFSHWQVWLALAGLGNVAALVLTRYGQLGPQRGTSVWFGWLTNFGRRA